MEETQRYLKVGDTLIVNYDNLQASALKEWAKVIIKRFDFNNNTFVVEDTLNRPWYYTFFDYVEGRLLWSVEGEESPKIPLDPGSDAGEEYEEMFSAPSKQNNIFSTGSQRDSQEGKGSFHLLPIHATILKAKHMEKGASKYEERNWEKGQPLSQYINSAMRHMFKALGGAEDEDHMVAAAWNLDAMVETRERIKRGILPKELDDLPKGIFSEEDFQEWSNYQLIQ